MTDNHARVARQLEDVRQGDEAPLAALLSDYRDQLPRDIRREVATNREDLAEASWAMIAGFMADVTPRSTAMERFDLVE
ncbi:hypothetical protein OJF2_56200 [Aquisphaera giovannonii]|uniref:Uncharacterized protein n=1 Tax=Aquisphaera giovannonii TaxID=406548 RepID=A0A5B9WAB6_9BACT|nr:hypothetical protein [Aquisphaera giovannonii]QEH37035.1 hypothetical protein OJF2_56200 [Aquisphaera giovannonii]